MYTIIFSLIALIIGIFMMLIGFIQMITSSSSVEVDEEAIAEHERLKAGQAEFHAECDILINRLNEVNYRLANGIAPPVEKKQSFYDKYQAKKQTRKQAPSSQATKVIKPLTGKKI